MKTNIIPFIVTMIVFQLAGFYPTDCFSECGKSAYQISDEQIDKENCRWKEFPLYGDIEFVESFPDIKVQIVDAFPDLKVKLVESFPNDCGEWKIVESFPDVKIQIVESFPDIKVQFVESFPGVSD